MNNKIKIARYEEIIKQVINNALNYEVNNKIAKNGTATTVQLTNDLSYAKIYIDCLRRENIAKIIENINRVKGFLRTKVSQTLEIYKTPQLIFLADEKIDYVNRIDSLLNEIKDKDGK